MKKVSVIIPVYNGSKFVESSITYLAEQNYSDMEVIFVVDTKTTDNSLDLIKENMNRLPNILVIEQDDRSGAGGARNIGIGHATGDIFWFMDIDDRPFPTFLSELIAIQEEHGADIVLNNFYRSDSVDLPDFGDLEFSVEVMDRAEALLSASKGKLPVTPWSKIYTRELIVENDLKYTLSLAEDIDYTFKALALSKTVCYFNKPLYLYYQSEGSICNSNRNNLRGQCEIDTYQRLSEYFLETDPDFYDVFCKYVAITRMRSTVHMDYPTFLETYKNSNVRDQIVKYYKGTLKIEPFIYRLSPWLYYKIAKKAMDKLYCKNNKMHDGVVGSGSSRMITKLVDRSMQ